MSVRPKVVMLFTYNAIFIALAEILDLHIKWFFIYALSFTFLWSTLNWIEDLVKHSKSREISDGN